MNKPIPKVCHTFHHIIYHIYKLKLYPEWDDFTSVVILMHYSNSDFSGNKIVFKCYGLFENIFSPLWIMCKIQHVTHGGRGSIRMHIFGDHDVMSLTPEQVRRSGEVKPDRGLRCVLLCITKVRAKTISKYSKTRLH